LLLFGEVETVSNRLFGNLILPLNLRGSFENADMNRPIIVIDKNIYTRPILICTFHLCMYIQ